MPVGSASGTWDMMSRLKSFRPEGWLALWKGMQYITEMTFLCLLCSCIRSPHDDRPGDPIVRATASGSVTSGGTALPTFRLPFEPT